MLSPCQVERPSKSGPIKIGFMDSEDPRCLYVRFKFLRDGQRTGTSRQETVLFVLKEFGVVTECFNYRGSLWWYVRYSTDKEAEYAEAALKLNSFEVCRKRPNFPIVAPNESSSSFHQTCNDTQLRLVEESPPDEQSQMNALHSRTSEQVSSVIRKESGTQQDTSTSYSGDCCRFLTHFRRHPKTVCCGCPFLYCCFFFIIAAFLFPITVFILVDQLELHIMQASFRDNFTRCLVFSYVHIFQGSKFVPVEVQILSWMPATVAVLVIVFRFCWAMCHSQTDRIRKSLAGSRGNMKTALGFMSEVKQEVAYTLVSFSAVTLLRWIARYTARWGSECPDVL